MKKSKISFFASIVLASAFGVFLGISPLTTFADEDIGVALMDVQYCLHNVNGNSGVTNFCAGTKCTVYTGQGSSHGACGSSGGPIY